MTPAEFEKRLQEISVYDGEPYGRLRTIQEEEEKHLHTMRKLLGYVALSDAFKCLFMETVERINKECRPLVKAPLSAHYPLYVARLVQSFRTLCGAERVAQMGYPYQGYTLLRNIFDNDVLTSAALLKLTDFLSIEGVGAVKNGTVDVREMRKLRKTVEFEVHLQMTGNKSGLSADTISELVVWNDLFDYETHGARLSFSATQDWLRGKAPLRVVPTYDEQAVSMFMNRFTEIAWMGHRLLPCLQPPEAPLPQDWCEKWGIIDDSFRRAVIALTEQLGKKIGAAVVEFVTVKFPYDAKSRFPL